MASNGTPASPLGELNEALQRSLLGALAVPVMAQQLTMPTRLAMLAIRRGTGGGPRLLPLVVMAGVAVVAGVAMASGWGLQTPGLLLFGLAACLANALALGRLGLGTSALALTTVLGLGVAERLGMLPSLAGLPGFVPRMAVHVLVIVAGTLVGRAIARLMQQHMTSAEAREQR